MTTEEWIAYHLARAPEWTPERRERLRRQRRAIRRAIYERELTPSEPVDAEDS
ncbi:MAG: hypothetical protein JWL97_4245 [Gemmatimonadales bacterium]|nr:hypothetical protein [Gemmatimonadales bacterium]